MIVFVHLVYYEKYAFKSLIELREIANNIGDKYKIILVNNNQNMILDSIFFPNMDLTILKGDNSKYEFSGWEVGLKYIKNNYEEEIENIIFSNDTFCFHRKWGYFQRLNFTNKFKKFYKDQITGICGEKNNISMDYKIDNISNDGWISTYLFMISNDLILQGLKLNNLGEKIYDYVIDVNDEEIIFRESFDKELGKHINNWLYPKKGKKGWYNSVNVNTYQKKKKLECILNEKILSCEVKKKGGIILGLNEEGCFAFINLIRKFINNFLRNFK